MTEPQALLDQLKNPYDTPPSFKELAEVVPEFTSQQNSLIESSPGKYTIDWRNDESVRCLTKALLQRDFDLLVDLPTDRLCPTVPSRLEYCLWVLKLSLLTVPSCRRPLKRRLIGMDIGTGASCIYPLLLSRLLERLELPEDHPLTISAAKEDCRTDYKIIATDIDLDSLKVARENIKNNTGCQEKIDICEAVQSNPDLIGDKLLRETLQEDEMIDFVMCNPPFYTSREEIEISASQKELEPFAVCTAASNELITEGGEVEFVTRMIRESLKIGPTRVRWFTSLIGKYSSLSPLVTQLRENRISNYQVHLLGNSGQTRRWILSWSLQAERIPPVLLISDHNDSSNLRKFCPQPPGIRVCNQSFPSSSIDNISLRTIATRLFENLGDSVTTTIEEPSPSIRISLKAKENCWSRAARRRSTAVPVPETGELNLLEADFVISTGSEGFELRGEWLRGLDSRDSGIAWDSLWGVLKRKIREIVVDDADSGVRAAGEDSRTERGRKKRKLR